MPVSPDSSASVSPCRVRSSRSRGPTVLRSIRPFAGPATTFVNPAAVAQSGGMRFDVVVIGGGAAGLNGALALVRSRRSVLVIDSGEPRNARAEGVHNFLTRDGLPPAELY